MTRRDLEVTITTSLLVGFAIGAALILASHLHVAWGKPPPGGPTTEAAWFMRQTNVVGGGCCELGDGHRLLDNQWRIVTNGDIDKDWRPTTHYEVMINNRWVPISPGQMRSHALDDPNPTGTAVVWYSEPKGPDVLPGTITVYCFAPGWGT